MEKIKLIVFDLGNILVELGDSPFPKDWGFSNHIDPKAWLHDECALKFEKGEIGVKELNDQLIKAHNLTQTSEELTYHFEKWIKGLYPDVLETIDKLKSHYKLAILSNTNEVHWPVLMKDFELEGNFDYYFASFLLKMAKPDIRIYEHVINETGFNPENILFFDDNLANIETAREAKINAVHLVGFSAVKKYLVENKYI